MNESAEDMIELRQLVKTYVRGTQKVEVLHGINLQIRRGEFVSIMGPSGSGKTTCLNIIAGLDTPTSGDVVVAGRTISRLSDNQLSDWRARHIGFIFQFYNLLPVLTAVRNVEVPLLLTRLSGTQRLKRALAALELVGLADRYQHRPGELSGGQQQRVSIARAIVTDPSVLVCDEPTGDVDRQSAADILDLLEILNRDHAKTIVMVTHDPLAAERATHRVHLDKGRLISREILSDRKREAV